MATTTVTCNDGFELGAYEASPAGAPKGAVVVIQEIFGVNSHIRSVVDGYAAEGYFAIAPLSLTASSGRAVGLHRRRHDCRH